MQDRCLEEVVELHRFFEGWFLADGEGETDPPWRRFSAVMADDFEMISPDGTRRSRAQLERVLREARGMHAGRSFAIEIDAVRVRPAAPGVWLVTYEEWHRLDGERRGRRSTAVLCEAAGAPLGLEWRHVHETWIPEAPA